jgi:hypothetical protein
MKCAFALFFDRRRYVSLSACHSSFSRAVSLPCCSFLSSVVNRRWRFGGKKAFAIAHNVSSSSSINRARSVASPGARLSGSGNNVASSAETITSCVSQCASRAVCFTCRYNLPGNRSVNSFAPISVIIRQQNRRYNHFLSNRAAHAFEKRAEHVRDGVAGRADPQTDQRSNQMVALDRGNHFPDARECSTHIAQAG